MHEMGEIALPLPQRPRRYVSRRPPVRAPVLAGLLILLVFCLGFGGWAALAPISSAAIAPGFVRVESNRKTVQHLEGGIIEELRVQDGDIVEAGQVLIRLDRTQAAARHDALLHQYQSLRADESRLVAERDGRDRIAFDDQLEGRRGEPRVAEILAGQESIFETRRRSYQGQIEILEQRIEQLRSEIAGLRAQVSSEDRQLALIAEETADVDLLLVKGLERKSRLLALRRQAALLEGSRGEHSAQIARAEQAIGETELEMFSLEDRLAAEVAEELEEVQSQLAETEEELRAAEDVLRRREIRAPIAGAVMDLQFFTEGGVIEAGVPILDIVPESDRLVIEAKVSPLDIDTVEPGLPAQVRLTAFKQRSTPTLEGRVVQVSADRLSDDSPSDEQAATAFYKADVEIHSAKLARLDGISLYPGMPAEVLIQTGERTLADYLIAPVLDSFARAFREE
jgi:HlyD family type I secretion membrane fusion protein